MIEIIETSIFLQYAQKFAILDVRSPVEYNQGHIPGAYNIPLFSNEARALIGTIYKKQGREAALLKGLEIVGPHLRGIIESIRKVTSDKTLLVYCARGGMRSGSISWLLHFFDCQVYTLKKGYKGFKNWKLHTLNTSKHVIVLAGKTGSGKTQILHELFQQKEQIIDLEALANHKGSAFGHMGKQPTQEQFENLLALQWEALDSTRPVYIEDESRTIGALVIPTGVWNHMRSASVLYLNMPLEYRVKRLKEEYGLVSPEELTIMIKRIEKRLGGVATQQALEAVNNNDRDLCCKILLNYYDKSYQYGLEKRDPASIEYFTVDACGVHRFGLVEHL